MLMFRRKPPVHILRETLLGEWHAAQIRFQLLLERGPIQLLSLFLLRTGESALLHKASLGVQQRRKCIVLRLHGCNFLFDSE